MSPISLCAASSCLTYSLLGSSCSTGTDTTGVCAGVDQRHTKTCMAVAGAPATSRGAASTRLLVPGSHSTGWPSGLQITTCGWAIPSPSKRTPSCSSVLRHYRRQTWPLCLEVYSWLAGWQAGA